ncbi:MAG: 4Fe-4S dicluster domain-containing protein [Thermoflexales bacterium]|nr:4Fe-4S dicluster domain-containing protein [Thermoflexales bacterium]
MFDVTFQKRVDELSGEVTELCYHCHKCTAGCPVAYAMSYGPDRVLRMVQLGQKEAALTCPDIWLCAGCETCGARCPNDIDIAHVMDALRQIALAEGVKPAEPNVPLFHDIFMTLVRQTGQMYEVGLMGLYLLRSGSLFADPVLFSAAPQLLLKGKAPILPRLSKNRARVKRVMEKEVGSKK